LAGFEVTAEGAEPLDAVVPELEARIERDVLPYLEAFGTRDGIIERWSGKAIIEGAGRPRRIVLAIILFERGDLESARELLRQQAEETSVVAHKTYVRTLASQIGVPLEKEGE